MGRKQKIPNEDFPKVAKEMIAWFAEHQKNLQTDKKMPFLGKFIREELHSSTSAFKRYTEQSEILRDALETVKEIQKEILIEGGLSGIFNPTAFIFSAMYRSAKQNITVLRSENGKVSVVAKGPWADIKDANLKYTRVLYCILVDGKELKRAEFDLQGIGLVQWGKLRTQDNATLTLAVSKDKSFKTPKGQFYEMTLAKKKEESKADTIAAELMAANVAMSFASFDENYAYREKRDDEATAMEDAAPTEEPTIDLDEPEEEKLKLKDIPF